MVPLIQNANQKSKQVVVPKSPYIPINKTKKTEGATSEWRSPYSQHNN